PGIVRLVPLLAKEAVVGKVGVVVLHRVQAVVVLEGLEAGLADGKSGARAGLDAEARHSGVIRAHVRLARQGDAADKAAKVITDGPLVDAQRKAVVVGAVGNRVAPRV